jgi:restriction endonuclease Mrr
VATPSVEIVAEWLIEEASNRNFKPIREVLQTALSFKLKENSPDENAEFSERITLPIIRELENRAAADRSEGITPSFEISSEEKTAYFRILDAPEQPVLAKLKSMEPSEFEKFCAKILSNLGAKSFIIGGPNDKGVDFTAINLQLGDKVKLAPRTSQAIVIGQAKRYNDQNITECDMREFIGGAILQADNLRNSNIFDAGLLSPVSFAYWTTSDFHHLARKYAQRMGVWYLNGIGLTQLALRAGVEIK